MEDIKGLYYDKFLNFVVERYKDDIKQAKSGHCLKITGLALKELQNLIGMIRPINPEVQVFILSDDLSGDDYVCATKLIELRNASSQAILALIPVNSRTSAEDSYGDATFRNLNVASLHHAFYLNLQDEIPDSQKHIWNNLVPLFGEKHLPNDVVMNYLLYVDSKLYADEAWGDGLYLLGMVPDSALLKANNLRYRYMLNYEHCASVLCDYSLPTPDRVANLPLKPNTLQKELIGFFNKERELVDRYVICKRIHEKYPQFNLSKWPFNRDEDDDNEEKNVVVRAEIVPGIDPQKELYKNQEGNYVVNLFENKKCGKVKLTISSNPAPKDDARIDAFQIVIMSRDDFAEGQVVRKFKLTSNRNQSRNITVELKFGTIEDGDYMLAVHALGKDDEVLDIDNPFKLEVIETAWQEASKQDANLKKDKFRRDGSYAFSNETGVFTIKNIAIDDTENIDEPGGDTSRRAKVSNYLQGYMQFHMAHLKDGDFNYETYGDEGACWHEGSLNNEFYFDFGPAHAFQIQLSKKLLSLEQSFLKHGEQLGHICAEASANQTDSKLQSVFFKELKLDIPVSDALKESRRELFELICSSAVDRSGVIATFDVAEYLGAIKRYLTDYSEWIRSFSDTTISEEVALEIQNIDTVMLLAETPDGGYCRVKLISPLHPLRLAWLVNIYELFNDWEEKTLENAAYKKTWYKKLDKLFMGGLPMDIAPFILAEGSIKEPFQYVGELTFGWGFYAQPTHKSEDLFASEYRQLLSYVAMLLNVPRETRIDSDVSLDMVVKHIINYAKAHPYTPKLVINLFNAGDASIFAIALLLLEKMGYSLDYEIRIFADDMLIQSGEALRDLVNPDSPFAVEEAEAFSQASDNRLFPKLRFSRNNVQEFVKHHDQYQAHLSFLINPFPVRTELVHPDELSRSFFLNGVMCRSVVTEKEIGKSFIWNRYFSEKNIANSISGFADIAVGLFAGIQRMTGKVMSSTQKESVPATTLLIKENDAMLLSFIHEVSDWVITFDKNMGPEFYDLPSLGGEEMPYLLDYVPSQETMGISSFLTTRPTSEVEGLMAPHFSSYGININDPAKFKSLLEDVRTVSSSILMQVNATQRKAFEVLGITLTKRFLMKKGLLAESFIIPIDLHKELFEDTDDETKERADNLVVQIDSVKREITMTVVEIKCRQYLGDGDAELLHEKIQSQVLNTISAMQQHFEIKPINDRLDRELKTLEFKQFLSFYVRRAIRYQQLDSNVARVYTRFLNTLEDGYTLRFKQLGVIFNFSQDLRQKKEYLGDLVIYTMGKPALTEILDDSSSLNTSSLSERDHQDDQDFINFFEPRTLRMFSNGDDYLSVLFDDVKDEHLKTNENVSAQKEEESALEGGAPIELQPVDNELKPEDEPTNISENQEQDDIHVEPAPEPVLPPVEEEDTNYDEPSIEMIVGDNKPSPQYGVLGKVLSNKRVIGIDLNQCNTISLFGVQGAGKSYTIGSVMEMTLKQFSKVNKLPAPMAGVIFHYSDSMDYAPEFTSMIYPNDEEGQLAKLKAEYGAEAGCVKDVLLLAPESQVENRKQEYSGVEVHPIGFDSAELSVKDWMFLLGATGNDSTYIKELKQIMKANRNNMSLENIRKGVDNSDHFSSGQRALASQRLDFADEYINDGTKLSQYLRPGRLIIVDLRDEFIEKDEALGLFVVMLNIFSSVMQVDGKAFNKFIVFDEAHKYMNNKELVDSITTAIREMRHKGVSVMIASQDPMSLPTEIIELSSLVIMHKFSSPAWVKHVQKAITALQTLTPTEMASLGSGEAFLWANKADDKLVTQRPIKISIRPRVTKHGGDTISAIHK